jgi:hypothetical protein
VAKTTAKPRFNVLEALPELAGMIKTTTRIHPRRGEVQDIAGSKIGGKFLWPANEKWPTMPSKRPKWWTNSDYSWDWKWDFPDGTEVDLTPVLQINQKDVKNFPFPKDKDLFQLFWLALIDDAPPYSCRPHVIWRSTKDVKELLADMPLSPHVNPDLVPNPCYLTLETVKEFPDIEELTNDQVVRLNAWLASLGEINFQNTYQKLETLYQFELSVCPSNKLGGHVDWLQYPEWPTCTNGHKMEHLLTLNDSEVDSGTWFRWLPLEDRKNWHGAFTNDERVNAPEWQLGGGSMYYFVCRQCENWPVKAVYQR